MDAFAFTAVMLLLALGSSWIYDRARARRIAKKNLALGYERRIGMRLNKKLQLSDFDSFLLSITPAVLKDQVSGRLNVLGKQGDVYVVGQLKLKFSLLLLGLIVTVALVGTVSAAAIYGFFIAAALFFLPDFRLSELAKQRRQDIGNLLPDALDQLTLLVDSGLDFQTAFVRVCKNSSGSLSDEFQRTLSDLQLGITRQESFENMGERTGSPVLKNFARSMVLADLFGVPVSNVLRAQAQELRDARRAAAEEAAQKVPTKITFPLVACLLPVILILLVGPSILGLVEVFK